MNRIEVQVSSDWSQNEPPKKAFVIRGEGECLTSVKIHYQCVTVVVNLNLLTLIVYTRYLLRRFRAVAPNKAETLYPNPNPSAV